ncbi:hypothetical protein QS713_07965 [Gleimia hominis]|uniref:Uncharacterized protein n=1 Tax=Gleimia hominis TaxID=595468 RepID=A0ABU3IFH6_9ACTO|nr:hypothetical protein [Gleimia hominis]MDT3767990.1 hypothetical protein [Gleimia hominis]
MSFVGWLVVVFALLLGGYAMPNLIRAREYKVNLPVESRFSSGLTVLDWNVRRMQVCGEVRREQPRLLASSPGGQWPRAGRERDGFGVQSREVGVMSRLSDTSREVPATSRQLARLRSARAARIARENAAGQRRLFAAGFSLMLLVAFVVAAVFGSFSPAWVVVPTVALIGVVVEGRLAYRRSASAAADEDAVLERLRSNIEREQGRWESLRTRIDKHASKSYERSSDVPEADGSSADSDAAGDSQTPVGSNGDTDGEHTNLDDSPEEGAESKGTLPGGWIPRPVPAPLYQKAPKAPRRQWEIDVVSEGDQVVAKVPARPVAATPMGTDAVSSDEAAQNAPVAFDLEEVLQQRRAQ